MNTMTNDLSGVVAADRAHVWHHLSQHKQYETVDPRVIVEGKGLRVWDAKGKEYIDAVSGAVWTVNVGYGRESIAKAVAEIYKVVPVKVNIINLPAKKVFARGKAGRKSGVRKASVYLKKGDKIEFV